MVSGLNYRVADDSLAIRNVDAWPAQVNNNRHDAQFAFRAPESRAADCRVDHQPRRRLRRRGPPPRGAPASCVLCHKRLPRSSEARVRRTLIPDVLINLDTRVAEDRRAWSKKKIQGVDARLRPCSNSISCTCALSRTGKDHFCQCGESGNAAGGGLFESRSRDQMDP